MRLIKPKLKSVGELIAEQFKETHDDHIVEKIIAEAETSSTNNSLMVYTSSVNRTNIEDRTMSVKENMNKVDTKIRDLEKALHSEAKRVDHLFMTADLHVELPSNNADIFTPKWERIQREINDILTAASEGKIQKDAVITVTEVDKSVFSDGVRITPDFMDAHDEFASYIEETYAVPMAKLLRERAALSKARAAERELDRLQ